MKVKNLEKELEKIFNRMVQEDFRAELIAETVHPDYRFSAKNLYRYLILRDFDLRKIHDSLSDLGISAMRSGEGYVFANVLLSLRLLNLILGHEMQDDFDIEYKGYRKSKKMLRRHANELFNKAQKKHFTEIMVTMPTEAAEDVDLLRSLVDAGMETARINCSHDDIPVWKKMIANIQAVSKELKKDVKIYMDMSGPKIRIADLKVLSKKGKEKSFIKIQTGEHLTLTKRTTDGKQAVYGDDNSLISGSEVGVLLPQIIDDLQVKDRVFFDDGMIEAVVTKKTKTDAKLLITKAYKNKLGSGKGINLPDTKLNLPSLTERDIELLPFICKHADIVGYSFVRTPEDVAALYKELENFDCPDMGVVLKIENKEAFENLPLMLFEAMKRQKVGVMIARGDLAVEIGFERIAEVQNQILWLCEAAHVPVIWATQVLENLAKTGIPTRAEVSDAVQSAQAECVMLNKGPYIAEAVATLKNILISAEAHSFKRKNALRSLNVARNTLQKMY